MGNVLPRAEPLRHRGEPFELRPEHRGFAPLLIVRTRFLVDLRQTSVVKSALHSSLTGLPEFFTLDITDEGGDMSTVDRRQTWIWGLGIATITAVTAFGVASWRADAAPGPSTSPGVSVGQATVSDPSPPAERAAGTGTDPLTTDELGKARVAALSPQLAAQARDVAGKAGPEYLSAELDESG